MAEPSITAYFCHDHRTKSSRIVTSQTPDFRQALRFRKAIDDLMAQSNFDIEECKKNFRSLVQKNAKLRNQRRRLVSEAVDAELRSRERASQADDRSRRSRRRMIAAQVVPEHAAQADDSRLWPALVVPEQAAHADDSMLRLLGTTLRLTNEDIVSALPHLLALPFDRRRQRWLELSQPNRAAAIADFSSPNVATELAAPVSMAFAALPSPVCSVSTSDSLAKCSLDHTPDSALPTLAIGHGWFSGPLSEMANRILRSLSLIDLTRVRRVQTLARRQADSAACVLLQQVRCDPAAAPFADPAPLQSSRGRPLRQTIPPGLYCSATVVRRILDFLSQQHLAANFEYLDLSLVPTTVLSSQELRRALEGMRRLRCVVLPRHGWGDPAELRRLRKRLQRGTEVSYAEAHRANPQPCV
jgi:hypothetical protein